MFIRKNLCHFVKFCSSDQEGRVFCVKVTGSNLNLLLFGCYLPCNDHSSNYLDNLSRIFGYIDSIAACNPGFRICILGDMNFECGSVRNPGYTIFKDFASEYSLVSCDDLLNGDVDYRPTYHHKTLNHKSFIDHVFIGQDLKNQITKFDILNDALNLSDHLPIAFHIS